jgi:hypothetical protein
MFQTRHGRYNDTMPTTLEDALRALDEAVELAKSIQVDLTDEYLQRIAEVEALPQNQSGADKTWAARLARNSKDYFARAVRVR